MPAAVLAQDGSARVRVHAARGEPHVPRGLAAGPARARRAGARRDHRRESRQDVVRDQWLPLVGRLGAAFAIGALMAWLLGRGSRDGSAGPIQALAEGVRRDRVGELRRARPRRARAATRSPPVRALQRDGGPARGDGGARAPVPHVGLARAADAPDRDQGPRRRAPRRAGRGPRARGGVARRRRERGDAARAARRRRARPRQAPRP